MRLLELNISGELYLTKDFINKDRLYVILSHTWEDDDDEVTFKDLVEGSGKTKSRYRKIQFCREQVARDDLQLFWVDTCCIDKSNNAELSEAINSIVRWYQNAVKYYVYLSNVSMNDYNEINESFQWNWEQSYPAPSGGLTLAAHPVKRNYRKVYVTIIHWEIDRLELGVLPLPYLCLMEQYRFKKFLISSRDCITTKYEISLLH
jgi:hypothetical protein